MIDYKPFWETLKQSEETTYTLVTRHRVSGATIDKLRKNKPVNAVSRFVLTEQFESTTRIYVLNRQNDETLTYTDVQLGTQLTKDFREIIKSRYVLEQVIDICGLQDAKWICKCGACNHGTGELQKT